MTTIDQIIHVIKNGCGNHGCVITRIPPGGMGTNTICQCIRYLKQLAGDMKQS